MSRGGDSDESSALEVSAGGVVFRRRGVVLEALLGEQIDRNSGARNTRLPKGHLDPGERAEEAAQREVLEETGVHAEICEELLEVRYAYYDSQRKRSVDKKVIFFLMERTEEHPGAKDTEMERVFWCALDEAPERLTFPAEQRVMRAALRRLRGARDAP